MAEHDRISGSAGTDTSLPRKRRTQAERAEKSRRRALDAAISCLNEEGYAATTTIRVSERAKISRGGLLHHFSSRLDLIEAVAREAVNRLYKKRKQGLGDIPLGKDRFVALTESTWKTMRAPEEIALLEILIASRSEEQLQQRLPAILGELNDFQAEKTRKIARHAGIEDGRALAAMQKLHTAAMRGLVIDMTFGIGGEGTEDAIALLIWYKVKLTEALTAGEPVLG